MVDTNVDKPGIFREFDQSSERVADFSYAPNDSLAQLVVDLWLDEDFRKLVVAEVGDDDKDKPSKIVKSLLATRGIHLDDPRLISEARFYSKHHLVPQKAHTVYFVLPDPDRVGKCPPGQNLLDTARLLMACTPHGI